MGTVLVSGFTALAQISLVGNAAADFLVSMGDGKWLAFVTEVPSGTQVQIHKTTDNWVSAPTRPVTGLWTDVPLTAPNNGTLAFIGGNAFAGVGRADAFAQTRSELWKSTDEGDTWTLKQTFDTGTSSTRTICFVRELEGDLWLGTALLAHLWKSTDDGETWADQGAFSGGTPIAVWDLVDCGGGVWVAATQEGGSTIKLWQSTNSGGAWTLTQTATYSSSAPVDLKTPIVRLTDGTLLYAVPNGTSDSLYRSTDDGATWTLVAGTSGYGQVVQVSGGVVGGRRTSSSTGITATESASGGATWADVSPASADGTGVKSLGVTSDGGAVIAGVGRSGAANNAQLYSAAVVVPEPIEPPIVRALECLPMVRLFCPEDEEP